MMSRIARFESQIASDSESLADRIARFETYLKRVNSGKALTAIRTVFGLAIRIVRFEIAANQWRYSNHCELRTAIQDISAKNPSENPHCGYF